jgi:acyl-CoA-binding protein
LTDFLFFSFFFFFFFSLTQFHSFCFVIGNETKLLLYGLFKQATTGNNTTPKPGWLDPVGRAKWTAWLSHADKPPHRAMMEYADELLRILRQLPPGPAVDEFLAIVALPPQDVMSDHDDDDGDDDDDDDGVHHVANGKPIVVLSSSRSAPPPPRTPHLNGGVPITPIVGVARTSNGSSSSDEGDREGSEYLTDDGEESMLRAVNRSQAALDEQHSRLVDKVDVVETRIDRLQIAADTVIAKLRRLEGGWLWRILRTSFVVAWPFVVFALCRYALKWQRQLKNRQHQ